MVMHFGTEFDQYSCSPDFNTKPNTSLNCGNCHHESRTTVTPNLKEYEPSIHITYKHNNKNIIHMYIPVL